MSSTNVSQRLEHVIASAPWYEDLGRIYSKQQRRLQGLSPKKIQRSEKLTRVFNIRGKIKIYINIICHILN